MVVDDPFTIVDFFSNSTNYIEQLPRRPSPGGDVFVTSQVRNNNNNNNTSDPGRAYEREPALGVPLSFALLVD